MEMWEKIQKMLKQNQQKNNWMIEIGGKNEVEMTPRLLLKWSGRFGCFLSSSLRLPSFSTQQ